MYEYDNRKFSSIKNLAAYVGLNEKTLTARLRRNIPLEEACNPILQGRIYVESSEGDTIAGLAKKKKMNPVLIYNRRKYGYTEKEAFNTPKKIRRQGKPIVVNGVMYMSIAMAMRELHLEKKESAIRRRLARGMDPNSAFHFEYSEHICMSGSSGKRYLY